MTNILQDAADRQKVTGEEARVAEVLANGAQRELLREIMHDIDVAVSAS